MLTNESYHERNFKLIPSPSQEHQRLIRVAYKPALTSRYIRTGVSPVRNGTPILSGFSAYVFSDYRGIHGSRVPLSVHGDGSLTPVPPWDNTIISNKFNLFKLQFEQIIGGVKLTKNALFKRKKPE